MSRDAETSHLTPAEGTEPDDAMLMAFADDALPAETAAALARRIAADPKLAAKVARYRADRELLRTAFDPVLSEPVPDRLVAAIRARAQAGYPAPQRPKLRAITGGAGWGMDGHAARPRPRWSIRRTGPLALAASLALVLGFTLGQVFPLREAGPPTPTGEERPSATASLAELALSPALAALAETGASGATLALAGSGTALVLGTLERAPGRWCREVEIAREGEAGLLLLCREPDGRWPVTALVAIGPAEATAGFTPAGSANESDPLEALRTALGGRLLDRDAEAELLRRRWR